jgi:hypothetical protein
MILDGVTEAACLIMEKSLLEKALMMSRINAVSGTMPYLPRIPGIFPPAIFFPPRK